MKKTLPRCERFLPNSKRQCIRTAKHDGECTVDASQAEGVIISRTTILPFDKKPVNH